jgi:hypothetical protein
MGDMSDTLRPMDDERLIAEQQCRHCGAKRGEGCTRSGKPTEPHKVRRDDWKYWHGGDEAETKRP